MNREHAHVTNPKAFKDGAASHSSANVKDGIGHGIDKYIHYSGPASHFPDHKKWVSFKDLFDNYQPWLQRFCMTHKWGPNNTLALLIIAREQAQADLGKDRNRYR